MLKLSDDTQLFKLYGKISNEPNLEGVLPSL